MQIATIGLDIAKHVFPVHAVDADGVVVTRKRYSRAQLCSFLKRYRHVSSGSKHVAPRIIGAASSRRSDMMFG